MHVRASLTDAARGLTDRQYVHGMLRAVISCSRRENTTGLERTIIVSERDEVVLGSGAVPTNRLVEIRNLAGIILMQQYATHKDFEWFAKLCDAQLLANGERWMDTVNQLGRTRRMTITWPNVSGFVPDPFVSAVTALEDDAYMLGMLRAVIPRAGEGWEALARLVLQHERGGQLFPVDKFWLNGKGNVAIAGRASYNILRTGGERVSYSAFAAACDELLQEPGDAPGDAWRRAVNSLVQEEP
jgi:hypothetical protein